MSNQYCEFEIIDNGNRLLITLTDEGKEEIQDTDRFKSKIQYPDYAAFLDMIEYQLCNGWDSYTPDQLGYLVDDCVILLSDNTNQDDQGNIIEVGDVYYFNNHATSSEFEELLKHGQVIFNRV